jgi:hypothetical protein
MIAQQVVKTVPGGREGLQNGVVATPVAVDEIAEVEAGGEFLAIEVLDGTAEFFDGGTVEAGILGFDIGILGISDETEGGKRSRGGFQDGRGSQGKGAGGGKEGAAG